MQWGRAFVIHIVDIVSVCACVSVFWNIWQAKLWLCQEVNILTTTVTIFISSSSIERNTAVLQSVCVCVCTPFYPTVLVLVEYLGRYSGGVSWFGSHLVTHIAAHGDVNQLKLDALALQNAHDLGLLGFHLQRGQAACHRAVWRHCLITPLSVCLMSIYWSTRRGWSRREIVG